MLKLIIKKFDYKKKKKWKKVADPYSMAYCSQVHSKNCPFYIRDWEGKLGYALLSEDWDKAYLPSNLADAYLSCDLLSFWL